MKTILITGTSKGIGKSIAKYLLEKKYKVIGISRKHTISHKNYFPKILDLNNIKSIKPYMYDIIKEHKKIDALVSNAGYGIFENLENLREEEIINYFNVNLFAHILVSKFLVASL